VVKVGAGAHREYVERAYRAFGHSVLRRATQILASEAEAKDVLQEVFVELLARPSQFEGRSELCTYLYSVTTHLCLNRIRNEKNRSRLREQRAGEVEPEVASAPDVWTDLRQALSGLSDEEARAAVHHYLDGMSHSEIGALLECSRRRVGDLLERARARLGGERQRRWGGVAG
jgi:RNA polymerase sigma factor (sigma-70 family)